MTWKEGWRSVTIMSMAQCAMISGIFLMLEWCADSLVSIQVVSFIMHPVCIDVDVSDKFSNLFPLPSLF